MAENESMMDQFVDGVRSLARGIVSAFRTGSWQVEEAADNIQTAEILLDRVDDAAEQDAQLMLDKVNDALVNWNRLNAKADGAREGVATWEVKAFTMAEKAKGLAADDPERAKLEQLVRRALKEKQRYQAQLTPLEKAIEAARPDYEQALELVEQIGYTKEQILSERQRLDVARANAETKKALASALRGGGDLKAQALLDQAREKVTTIEAEAKAETEIADRLPASETQMDAEIAAITGDDAVEAEFAELMNQ